MKRLLASLFLVFTVSACSTLERTVDGSAANKVASFKAVEPIRWELPNGLSVIYLEDKELPVVQGQLIIRGGSLWAEGYPVGTTSAMGEVMRTGGAGELSADALDRELEKLAAGVSSSFSTEFGSVSFSCLSSDLERVFKLFSDVALRPRFEQDKLSLWKGQSLESIRRRVEDPGTVASIAFTQLVYGDSIYGRVSRSRDISSITRAHLERLHGDLMRPDGAILVVTGSVERAAVERLVSEHFIKWAARGKRLPLPPPVNYEPKPGIYFIKLPFAQASVKSGHLGVPRLTSDYPAIDLFNEVFGSGGFGSRLMQKVRTELGLSYGVYGGIAPAVVKGTNYIFLQTKAESTGAALAESVEVLERLRREAPSTLELSEKREAINNSFVFNFSSKSEIAGRMARHELLGYPVDYDASYLSKIAAVTPADVTAVAAQRWDPTKLVTVVVGNEQAYRSVEQAIGASTGRLSSFELRKLGFDEAVLP
jgi:zinc protease